jgi:hypothetical protein
MTNPQSARESLEHFAQNIDKWRTEAARLRQRADRPKVADTETLVQVEDTAGDIYREIESFKTVVAGIAEQSPEAAGELAEVGETLHLLLLEITEQGTRLYSTRSNPDLLNA